MSPLPDRDLFGPTIPRAGPAFPSLPGGGAPPPPNKAKVEPSGDGLIVGLVRIPGVTAARQLKQPFWFQCPPINEMPRDITWNWNDYPSIDSGMHSNPSGIGLDVYTFQTVFVDDDRHHHFALYRDRHVLSMLKDIESLGNAMTPFQLQYGQPALWGVWDKVVGVTLRSMHISEQGGEPDARYVTLSFTEFADVPRLTAVPPPKHPHGKKGSHKGGSTGPHGKILARLNSAHLPKNMRTLAAIAKRYYGSASAWRLIAKASGLKTIGPNVDLPSTVGKRKPPAQITVPAAPKKSPPGTKKKAK